MMSFLLSSLVSFIWLINSSIVQWKTDQHDSVSVRAPELEEQVAQCLESARQAKVRFDLRLCHRSRAWFDACAATRSRVHTVEFDAISESYKVFEDRYGDDSEPLAVGVTGRNEAVHAMTSVDAVSIDFLTNGDSRLLNDPDLYLQVRTSFSCKGAVNRTIARLSQVLTLGLVDVVETTSDWVDVELTGRAAKQ